jgi:hypothetical protein
MHIEGVMRSANATGLMEMAAARDEYWREVNRLRAQLVEANKDRATLGAALQKNRRAEISEVDNAATKIIEESNSGSDATSANADESLKSVIRAQHKRICELKLKLKSGVRAKKVVGNGNGVGNANGNGNGNGAEQQRAESPSKQTNAKERANMHLQRANRVDLRGQMAAAERVAAKKRETIMQERKKEKMVVEFQAMQELAQQQITGSPRSKNEIISVGFENMFE